jgi:hypothetical protein
VIKSIEFKGIDAWISGAARFGGDYGKGVADDFDAISKSVYDDSQAIVHVITGELKASGQVILASSEKTGMGIEAVEGGVSYTSEHGFWEMLRGGEHDFLTEPMARHMPEYRKVFDLNFSAQLSGWK